MLQRFVEFVKGLTVPPAKNEIAGIGDGRDITRGYTNFGYLTPQDTILMLEGRGDLRTYEKVLQDEQVKSCMQQRVTALTGCEWDVLAGDDRRISKKAADFVKDTLQSIPLNLKMQEAAYGIFYGFTVAEMHPVDDGLGEVVLDADMGGISVRNRRRFKFGEDRKPRLITFKNPLGEEFDELALKNLWWFSAGGDNSDDPYGRGLAHWLFWLTFFKRNDLKYWLIFLEKFAQPTTVGKYPRGATKEEQGKLLAAGKAVQADSTVIIPEGMILELLEANRSGTLDYSTLWDKMNAAIAKVILSQTMTTDNGSSKSQSETHLSVRQDVIRGDRDLICDSFNMHIVRNLMAYNAQKFEGAAMPKFWYKVTEPLDTKAESEKDKNLFSFGFRPSAERVADVYGEGAYIDTQASDTGDPNLVALNQNMVTSLSDIAVKVSTGELNPDSGKAIAKVAFPQLSPELIDQIFVAPTPKAIPTTIPPVNPAPPVQFADTRSVSGVELIRKGGVFDFAEATKQSTVEQFTERLRNSAAPQVEAMTAQIKQVLDSSKDLAEFRDKLDGIYPDLDGEQLTKLMAEAMFASKLAGIFEAENDA